MTALPNERFSRVVRLSEVSKRPMSDKKMTEVMTLPTPFDGDGDAAAYKWAEIRDKLGLSSNVANARWMPEKIMPLLANLEAPPLLTGQGKPTKFCAQMLSRYKVFCNDDKNDYGIFAEQVRNHFSSDAAKPVSVEVLPSDDDGDKGLSPVDASAPLSKLQQQTEEAAESLEGKIMLAMQLKQDVGQLATQYQQASEKSWEQQVIEDEIDKFNQEQARKKQELALRLKVRQMLENNGQPSS